MLEYIFTINYLQVKKCFCYLSSKNVKQLQANVVQLNYGDSKSAYCSVDCAEVIIDDNIIGISSLYARILGIQENETVTVSEVPKLPTISNVTIAPLNESDYEVMELLAEDVQLTLLDQIRVLNNGQKIIIWVGSIHVSVHVSEIKPSSPGCIGNFTEVIIKPPDYYMTRTAIVEQSKQNTGFFSSLNPFREDDAEMNNTEKDLLSDFHHLHDFVLRIVPLSKLNHDFRRLQTPFTAFLFKCSLPPNFNKDSVITPLIYSMTLLKFESDKTVHVRLCIFENYFDDFRLNTLTYDHLFVSDEILNYFDCQIGARVKLKPHLEPLQPVREIEICTKTIFLPNIEDKFKVYLGNNCAVQQFVLNSNVIFNIDTNLKCFVRFQPVQSRFTLIDGDFVRNCKYSVHDEVLPIEDKREIFDDSSRLITKIANYQDIIDDCQFNLIFNGNSKCFIENALIQGQSGSGKSTILMLIERRLNESPTFIFTKTVQCKSVKGKMLDGLHKYFKTIFLELSHHQPAVLLLDDLHVLCQNVNESDPLAQNVVYHKSASEMLEMLINYFCIEKSVGIIATTESTLKLNKYIYRTRGAHLFKNVYSINSLKKEDRKMVLEFLFSKYDTNNINFDIIALKSESFVMQDLIDFTNKAIYESYVQSISEKSPITQEHCESALKNTTITALQDVNVHSPGIKDFSDIGGLNGVKQVIVETMLWPIQYPKLFEDPPIRLPTGLLLYGAPGTGKTLIAGAAARHCGLRLISIKGPELLSKYIGASEQAVRDVFEKAQTARPCILFFDEFDSLAPRRGHDNTGVTDRVVNQLLTQLDGVEVLAGVWVLAATSRPDLLDPALLRPGRLDRNILCPLPDKRARHDILTVLSKSINFAEDVDLNAIAEKCDGFTGADLQSVLYSAQMDALDDADLDEEINNDTVVEINQYQLLEAIKKTRPSLGKEERQKFDNIYEKFQGGEIGNFSPGSKATLA